MNECMYVCMYIYMYVFMYAYMYVLCMCVCMYVCLYVCMYVFSFERCNQLGEASQKLLAKHACSHSVVIVKIHHAPEHPKMCPSSACMSCFLMVHISAL